MQHGNKEPQLEPETPKNFDNVLGYLINVKGMSEGHAKEVALELVNDPDNTIDEIIIPSEEFSTGDIYILRTLLNLDNLDLEVLAEIITFLIDIKQMSPDLAKSLACDFIVDSESVINEVLIPSEEFTDTDIKNLENLLNTVSK